MLGDIRIQHGGKIQINILVSNISLNLYFFKTNDVTLYQII